ncbi:MULTISPECIES: hypothetical protein [unclassified Streptomyces]|uniref:hypothetical protein n=1 Tax=unclassified Streptomyces TaxID=2593676 RepID=UPI001BE512B2|nr:MULTISPECIES: hypothetical protein [unclassified Streptomyces]MBT2402561.1 hypothetical protein [Streptomyces sp. ISL-21]MBT2454953.1 hypothetical protein [Streptomyces sp. ISL-86]MBT2611844.1 hypothetical protein [Streptomyces sp. ISL-87]
MTTGLKSRPFKVIYAGTHETMRITPLLTTATAVTALLVLTACGSGDSGAAGNIGQIGGLSGGAAGGGGDGGPMEGTLENPTKNGGVNGGAPKDGTPFQRLPKAGTMAAAARFINGYTRCSSLSMEPTDDESPDTETKYDGKWSVTEQGFCGHGTRILMYKDAKKFQAAYKADLEQKMKESPNRGLRGGFLIGQDFAVLTDSGSAIASMSKPGGLLILNCHPKFTAPSGYVKANAQVKGCVLTDYFNDN